MRLGGESVVPPLNRPRFEVFPNIPLSFTALSEFTACPTRFYARRVLGMGARDQQAANPLDDPGEASILERDRATDFGVAVHEYLETLGRRRWPEPKPEQLAEVLARHDAGSAENLDRAAAMIEAFLGSNLGATVREGQATFEVPLLLRVAGITIRGFVDVLLDGATPTVIDYKTNRLDGKTPDEKIGEYEIQRDLYALALARARETEDVRTAFVFLERADEPVESRFDAEDLEKAEGALRRNLSEIVEGKYFGGPTAAHQPCDDCWACRRLSRQLARAA
jgi:ATP-dependent exoDNAse (exonuclease V) beta subunit